jgi:predicted glycoside hydrolase/deacetylase ChbG (UPF0249 family)
MLVAARAGAVDAVGAMVLRDPEPGPLLETGVEIGLHLEPLGAAPLAEQWARFEAIFGTPPAYLDGHKHCHTGAAVADLARRQGVYVRSIDDRHRAALRAAGVRTCDRLIGRMAEDEPPVPAEIEAWLRGRPPPGETEWMVHPGYAGGPSSFDRGREQDLELLLELRASAPWRAF